MPRVELSRSTTVILDKIRGDQTREKCVSALILQRSNGRLVHVDEIPMQPSPIDEIIDEAVWEATYAFTHGRPGYGRFVLQRTGAALTALEEAKSSKAWWLSHD